MFIRVALLLLLAHAVLIESSKIQNALKKVGKRYYGEETMGILQLMDGVVASTPLQQFNEFSDEEVEKFKEEKAFGIVRLFATASSNQHHQFKDALTIIESILDPKMTAEICGEEKRLNSYQFMKHLLHSSSQYNANSPVQYYFDIMETERNFLHMVMNFTRTDKSGLEVVFEYELKLSLTMTTSYFYSIIHLIQGGSCADRGLASFTNTELEGVAWLIDDIEGLQEKPTVKLFFKLFTPAVYQYIEENPNKLPRYWLSGLNSSLTSINVCHEKMTDTFAYTEDQFRSWYVHFGLMWHPKEGADDTYTLQVLELKPDSIIARVTMKLQMGRKEDAPVHDWNFKFSGKKKDGVWYFEKIDVMCDPTIEYKDESLKLIREVVAGKFVDELKYKNDTQWYSTVDFIKQFTKHGHLVMEDCVNDIVGLITQIDLFKKDRDDVHGIKFTKYQIDEETAIDLPAADTATFRFKTVSQAADSTEEEKVEIEREWSFDIKWDQKDQFYYIEKMGIGCAKPWTVKGVFKSIVDTIGKKK
ncbi:hypothetical protein GCK72_006826 [Caenorhabditis remanei]|uniref:NTF2-like domain-containing protein n=1 Tax=Caenorhabditis remanei TaxID=31234 RepID=A0A6A5HGA3_CAERE|nr:hypothetical protein GCK72_006826 [Caenorhabditis remanei]KAF1766868.1 hypothetical protein GCK72_006826 [Caenorhabditis remanei]